MSAAPITMSATPAHRRVEKRSSRNHMAAKVAKTKLNPVRGQRKLMSLFDIRTSRHAKNNASKKTPDRMQRFAAPALITRATSLTVTFLTSPICDIPFFNSTTPVDSKTSPMSKIKSNLAISQILAANQFDAEFFNLFLHSGADQSIKLVLKYVERRMRVKLR